MISFLRVLELPESDLSPYKSTVVVEQLPGGTVKRPCGSFHSAELVTPTES